MIVKVIDAAAITEALAVVTAVGEEWKMRPSTVMAAGTKRKRWQRAPG